MQRGEAPVERGQPTSVVSSQRDQLYISRNTVKTHVRHVYTKLGVASRDAAVEEARRLGIT